MEYIIQIFTGGWKNRNYTADEICERIGYLRQRIPVRSVIIGWFIDPSLYQEVNHYLHDNGISSYLWMPVFSETSELVTVQEALDIYGKPTGSLALQEGESFAFYCPSVEANRQAVYHIYDKYFSSCAFDGIFLDKIRTQSFVGGINGILSCGCPDCSTFYRQAGLDLEELRKLYEQKGDAMMETSGYEKGKGFVMKYALMEDFLRIKGEIIADSVSQICRHFHAIGLKTGLDLYAPLLSRFTGQDYSLIAKEADFIKPMLYRCTEAPAGINFEYKLLKQSLPHTRNYPEINTDLRFLHSQLEEFKDLPCLKYPGIEVNYRKDIARTDRQYVRESLQAVKDNGMDGAVLAWDIMLAPDSHIEVLQDL